MQKDKDIIIRLKEEMERKNINAKKLAEDADVGASFVYDILNGNSKNPTIKKISLIADVLGVDVSYLVNKDNINRNKHGNNTNNIVAIKSLLLETSESCGKLVFENYTSTPYYFQKEWVDKQLQTSVDNLFILAMDKKISKLSIQKGDLIIIDTTKNIPQYDNIFLIWRNANIYLHKISEQKIENTKNIDTDIIGQVVWLSRNF